MPKTRDYGTDGYVVNLTVKPIYEAYHWYSTAADFSTSSWGDAVPEDAQTFVVQLERPNRIPTGVLELTDTKKGMEYMTNIEIWKEKSDTSKDPDYTIPGSFYNGEAATIELPKGSYKVQVKLGPSQDALETYHSRNKVEIRLAETTAVDAGFEFAEGAL